MNPKARVLGSCYVCGKPVWGRRTTDPKRAAMLKGNVATRDAGGVRHARCRPSGPGGFGSPAGVTVTDP